MLSSRCVPILKPYGTEQYPEGFCLLTVPVQFSFVAQVLQCMTVVMLLASMQCHDGSLQSSRKTSEHNLPNDNKK